MNTQEEELAKKLQFDPAILLLGQSYLADGSKDNLFISKILDKWHVPATRPSYNSLFEINEPNKTAIREWCQKLSESISVPDNLKTVASFPWNHLYTSAIDNIVYRAFKTDSRTVQPIYDQSYRLTDPRSRSMLHETFLYGQLQYSNIERKAPLSKLEFGQRSLVATLLLNRLPVEVVTPKGVLVVEGWDPDDDWLTADTFYSIGSQFGEAQVHIFSAHEGHEQNLFLTDLVKKRKAVLHKMSLARYLILAQAEGKLDVEAVNAEPDGLWLFFGEKRVKVPDHVRKQVSKSAIILHPQLFEYRNPFQIEETAYEFRNFISYSTTIPRWEGYSKGFAFRRSFVEDLQSQILRFAEKSDGDKPIILHGQGSSGKTIGLGATAYELLKNKSDVAILFIERSYRRLDENAIKNIDDFCIWAEDNGTDKTKTVIVYDGMYSVEYYQTVLRNLTSRGRKVILVGSAYLNKEGIKNSVVAPIQLEPDEKNRFASYIQKFISDKPLVEQLIKSSDDKNFLSILYHYLPDSKSNISALIRSEAKHVSDTFQTIQPQKRSASGPNILRDLLLELGFTESNEPVDDLSKDMSIGGEVADLASHFINIVMSIGKLGLPVPFELLIRALGARSIEAGFFKNIPNTDLIRWHEDHNGNISVGPRTALEARIYCYSLGGIETEVEFINKLLGEIRDSTYSLQEDREIEFTTLLLHIVKKDESPFRPYLYEFAKTLTELRESNQAYHPRLMLQEASLYQECVKNEHSLPIGVGLMDLLDLAEEVVQEALDAEKGFNNATRKFLKVELASIIGSKGIQLKRSDPTESQLLFQEARANILQSGFTVENYHALDILLWTIRNQATNSKSDTEKLNLYVEAQYYIQYAEEEGIAASHLEKFKERKYEIGQALDDVKLTEQAFDELKAQGSKVGYYLRAMQKLGDLSLGNIKVVSDQDSKKIDAALSYLMSNLELITTDGKCLFLLLKLWWLSNTKKPIFAEEKVVLKFSKKDWFFLRTLTSSLLQTSDDFLKPSVQYLYGLSQFHSDDISGAMETFRELSDLSELLNVGSRRIKKYYITGNEDGTAKVYSGIMDRNIDHVNKSSVVTVENLNKRIKIFYNDFRKSLNKGDVIEFFIGFNFIGPVATPVR